MGWQDEETGNTFHAEAESRMVALRAWEKAGASQGREGEVGSAWGQSMQPCLGLRGLQGSWQE